MALKRRIVVVGLGSIGCRHARLLLEREDLTVEFCEPDSAVLTRAKTAVGGCKAHASFDDALASRPDLMVIATPHQFHSAQSIAAIEAGIPTLCEKPMGDSLPAAQAMLEAAGKTRVPLVIGFNMHFHPGLQRLKALVDGGEIGTPLCAHFHVGTYVTLLNSVSRYQAAMEGALLLDYAHQPDALCWIMGSAPRGVYAAGGQGGVFEHTSNPNFISLLCDYGHEALASIHLNYLEMPERCTFQVIGDRGTAIFDQVAGIIRIGSRADNRERQEPVAVERDAIYRAEHQAFLDAVDGKRTPESPAASAIMSMKIIDAALRSWLVERRVPLDETDKSNLSHSA